MKKELRVRMRAIRKALPADARAKRSRLAMEQVLALDEFRTASVVAAFSSLTHEIDVSSFVGSAFADGKRVALPRVVGDDLVLHEIDGATELEEGAFAVLEPPESCEVVRDEETEFVLVPALAFDPNGQRLGYGGGYYDRLLRRLPRACACVVGFDFQLVSELPSMDHDVPVQVIVTDSRVIRV